MSSQAIAKNWLRPDAQGLLRVGFRWGHRVGQKRRGQTVARFAIMFRFVGQTLRAEAIFHLSLGALIAARHIRSKKRNRQRALEAAEACQTELGICELTCTISCGNGITTLPCVLPIATRVAGNCKAKGFVLGEGFEQSRWAPDC